MGQKNLIKPIILYEGKNTIKDLETLKEKNPFCKILDIYADQLKELFEITQPHLKQSPDYQKQLDKFIAKNLKQSKYLIGNWIYFPWSGELIHTVNEKDYFLLRTNRNKNLIDQLEQIKLYNFCVGVVGLSVGGSIATGLSYQGIAKNIKLAEFDTLETTNLNRVRARISDIGMKKMDIVTRQIYEIDPYANLICYGDGLIRENLKTFIRRNPKPKVIFEIIDDFEMKILLRLEARKAGIPIIMMANLGDSVLIDIERYDLDSKLPLFNGILGNLPERILENPNEDRNKYAVQIVGIENVPRRAIESVKEIGKTLVGRPQLSSTVTTSSAFAVYLVRCIALSMPLKSGRYKVSFDTLFNLRDNSNNEQVPG